MKHALLTRTLLPMVIFSASTIINGTAQTSPKSANSGFCNLRALSDSCRPMLKPFHYSGQNALHVALKSQPQVREITFPAFQGEKYRVIINTTYMPKGTEVDVYGQDSRRKKRQPLYTTRDNGVSNFDVDSKSYVIYIDYTIPAATATDYSGCAVIMIGYENNFDNSGN